MSLWTSQVQRRAKASAADGALVAQRRNHPKAGECHKDDGRDQRRHRKDAGKIGKAQCCFDERIDQPIRPPASRQQVIGGVGIGEAAKIKEFETANTRKNPPMKPFMAMCQSKPDWP